jgi:hypothetical protein
VREHLTALQRDRLRSSRLAHEPQVGSRIFGYPVAVVEPLEEKTQALETSIHSGWRVGLLMNQIGSKRGEINGSDVYKQRWGALVNSCPPPLETGDIIEISLHRRRR